MKTYNAYTVVTHTYVIILLSLYTTATTVVHTTTDGCTHYIWNEMGLYTYKETIFIIDLYTSENDVIECYRFVLRRLTSGYCWYYTILVGRYTKNISRRVVYHAAGNKNE